MKKIQLKSTLAKETNPFRVSERMKLLKQQEQNVLLDIPNIAQQSQGNKYINESGLLSNKSNTSINTSLRLNKQSNMNILNQNALQNPNNNSTNNRGLSIEKKSTLSWQNQDKSSNQQNQEQIIQKEGTKLRNIPKNARQLLDEMQIQLKYQRSPKEVQNLEKIEQIIRDSKNSAKSKAQSEIQSSSNIQTPPEIN